MVTHNTATISRLSCLLISTGEEDDVLSGSDDYSNEEDDADTLADRQHLSDAAKLVSNLKNLTTNGQPCEIPEQLDLGYSAKHETSKKSVLARVDLKQGTRFGPYPGRISKDKLPNCYNLKVSPET